MLQLTLRLNNKFSFGEEVKQRVSGSEGRETSRRPQTFLPASTARVQKIVKKKFARKTRKLDVFTGIEKVMSIQKAVKEEKLFADRH